MKRSLKKAISGLLCTCFVFSAFSIDMLASPSSQNSQPQTVVEGSLKPPRPTETKFKTPSELKASFEAEVKETDRFIIKYKSDSPKMRSFSNSRGLKSNSKIKSIDEITIQTDSPNDISIQTITLETSVNADDFIAQEMSLNSEIEYIQPDYKLQISELTGQNEEISPPSEIEDTTNHDETNQEQQIQQPDLEEQIDPLEQESILEEEIPIETTEKIIVAVIDTGIDITHPDLKDKIFTNPSEEADETDTDQNGYTDDINGWNFVNKNNVIYDENADLEQVHGTQIAGIISGLAKGNYGISEDSDIVIMPLKVFSNGEAYTSDIIAAINYAEEMGAKVINCSFGSTVYNQALMEAMGNSSALFVCAAGNGRSNLDEKPVYPAAFGLENVISVTSVNNDGGLSYFSNYGENTVDIAAPGRNVESTIPGNRYGKNTGSSMSAAFVSGTAAHVLKQNPDLNASDIKTQIIDGADKISPLDGYVAKAARFNPQAAIAGIINNMMISISAKDDFNTTGYASDSEQMRLFGGAKNIAVASGGYHNLVLKDDGTVWAWGDNSFGQLGNGEFGGYSEIPVQVMELSNIVQIDAGQVSSMALDANGNVWTWGGNYYGQLGLGHSYDSCVPMQVSLYSSTTKISMGANHCVALGYSIASWGSNRQLQLGMTYSTMGTSTTYYVTYPANLVTYIPEAILDISCGNTSTMIMTTSTSNVKVIGNGRVTSDFRYSGMYGELQNYGNLYMYYGGYKVAAGNMYNLCLSSYYCDVYQWENIGVNGAGVPDDAVTSSSAYCAYYDSSSLPTADKIINRSYNVADIESTIGNTNLVLTNDGIIKTWGQNSGGTFGNGTEYGESSTPETVDADAFFVDMDGGYSHIAAIDDNGNIWGWGTNSDGVLGSDYDGSYEPRMLFGGETDPEITLDAPTGLAVCVVDSVSIALSWNAVSGPTSYDIDYNGTIVNVSETSAVLTELEPDTTYTIKIMAKNSDTVSEWSGSISVTTLPTPLNAPTGLTTGTITDTTIALSWGAVFGATSYDVDYNGTIKNVTGTSSTLTGLEPNTTYVIKVMAKNASTTSNWSSSISRATLPTPLNAPTGLTIGTITDTSIALSWNAVYGAISYDIDCNGAIVNVSGTSTTLTDLEPNAVYTIKVMSKNSDTVSEWSESISATTLPSPLNAPTGLTTGTITDTSIALSWNAVSGATSYDVDYNGTIVNVTGVTTTLDGLEPNTAYTIKVMTKNSDTASSWSESITATTLSSPLNAPTGLATGAITDTSIALSWNAVSGATSYDVDYNGTIKNVTGTSSTLTELTPNTAYSIKIMAKNSDTISEWGESITVTTLSLPLESPTGLIADDITDTSMILSWNAVSGASSYDVDYNGEKLNVTATSATLTSLEANTPYTVRVMAKNANTISTWSNSILANTLLTHLNMPTSLVASEITDIGVKLTWNPVIDATNYDVYYNGAVLNVSGTSATLNLLNPGISYTIKVVAKGYNAISLPSNPIEIKTLSSWFNTAKELSKSEGIYKISDVINDESGIKYFKIIPEETAVYSFALDIPGYRSKISLYDSNRQPVPSLIFNSELKSTLLANQTYYITISSVGTEVSDVNFELTAIKIKDMYMAASPDEGIIMSDKILLSDEMHMFGFKTITDDEYTVELISNNPNIIIELSVENSDKVFSTSRTTKIQASAGNFYGIKVSYDADAEFTEAEYTLKIYANKLITNDNVTLQCTAGEYYYLPVTIFNVQSFENMVFTVNYSTDQFQLIDCAAQVKPIATVPGVIANTPITIISNGNGEIKFSANISIPPGKMWGGVLTVIKFKALIDGPASVSVE